MGEQAIIIASLVLKAWQLWDNHTQAEQQRSGKTAAQLLDDTLAQIGANDEYAQQLKDKFSALETTPE